LVEAEEEVVGREIKTVKLQMAGDRNFVTIPKSVVNILGLAKGEEFGVYINLHNDIVLHRKGVDERD